MDQYFILINFPKQFILNNYIYDWKEDNLIFSKTNNYQSDLSFNIKNDVQLNKFTGYELLKPASGAGLFCISLGAGSDREKAPVKSPGRLSD